MESSALRAPLSSPHVGTDIPLPLALVTDLRVSSSAVRCWAYLATLGPGACPSREQVSAVFAVAPDTASRWFILLEKTGWITRQPRNCAPWEVRVNRVPVI